MAMLCTNGGIQTGLTTPISTVTPLTSMLWVLLGPNTSPSARNWWYLAGEVGLLVGTTSDGKTLQLTIGSTNYVGGPLPIGQWFHFAVSVQPLSGGSSQQIKVHINGVLQITATNSSPQGYGTILLGYASSSGNTVAIESYKMWTGYTLSPQGIREESRTRNARRRAGLYCWYPLETAPFCYGTTSFTFYMLDKSGYNRTTSQAGGGPYTSVPGPVLPFCEHKRNSIYVD